MIAAPTETFSYPAATIDVLDEMELKMANQLSDRTINQITRLL